MRWTLRKIDSLVGTILAAIAGIATSQLQAFIQHYQQRLGGHLDEARRTHGWLADEVDSLIGAASGEGLADTALARVAELQAAHDAVAGAGVFTRPFVFLRHVDGDIALATWHEFQPALPLDAASLVYGAIGMVLGWMLYELTKAPFGLVFGGRARSRRA